MLDVFPSTPGVDHNPKLIDVGQKLVDVGSNNGRSRPMPGLRSAPLPPISAQGRFWPKLCGLRPEFGSARSSWVDFVTHQVDIGQIWAGIGPNLADTEPMLAELGQREPNSVKAGRNRPIFDRCRAMLVEVGRKCVEGGSDSGRFRANFADPKAMGNAALRVRRGDGSRERWRAGTRGALEDARSAWGEARSARAREQRAGKSERVAASSAAVGGSCTTPEAISSNLQHEQQKSITWIEVPRTWRSIPNRGAEPPGSGRQRRRHPGRASLQGGSTLMQKTCNLSTRVRGASAEQPMRKQRTNPRARA